MEKVTAIVTVYYPEESHVKNIIAIAAQVDRVIICDNSPYANKEMFTDIPKLVYISYKKNYGLSAAFNNVLRDAYYLWDDEEFIVFFDQDSVLTDGHMESLLNDYLYLEKKGISVGCLGPVYYNMSNEKIEIPKLKKSITNHIMQVKSIITTSMMTRYKNISHIGFWNEQVFLDMADWDLCWRLEASGMKCFLSDNSILNHSVGEGKKKIGIFEIRIGKPFREYYETRDCLYLLKEKYVPFKYKLRFWAMLTLRPLLHIAFLKNKHERYYYIRLGFAHYLKRKHGELENVDMYENR